MAKLSKAQVEMVADFKNKVDNARCELRKLSVEERLGENMERERELLLRANGIYLTITKGSQRTVYKLYEMGYFKTIISVMYQPLTFVLNLEKFGIDEQWEY